VRDGLQKLLGGHTEVRLYRSLSEYKRGVVSF
jgi:hypothetical protein